MPKFAINQKYVPVPVYFIDTYLKDTSGLFLKVYLYALKLAVSGSQMDTAQIAENLNVLESDVLQAIKYWEKEGMILEDSGIVEFLDSPINDGHEKAQSVLPAGPSDDNGRKHYDSIQIAKLISEDQSLSELVLLAQELLGKPLSSSDLETIYWMYDELSFSTEAILLIFDYCISKEKRNLKYIEKVAIAWHQKNIITTDQIMKYISDEEHKNTALYQIQKILGISDRNLSAAETQYIKKWLNKYNMSEDMISLAYEFCLLNTTKLSFPYMDKIMERWDKQNIRTKEAAMEDNRQYKSKASAGFNAFDDNFNHDALEQLTRNNNTF